MLAILIIWLNLNVILVQQRQPEMQANQQEKRLLFLTGVANGGFDTLPLIQQGKHNAASYKMQVKPLIDTARTIGLSLAAINLYKYADNPFI